MKPKNQKTPCNGQNLAMRPKLNDSSSPVRCQENGKSEMEQIVTRSKFKAMKRVRKSPLRGKCFIDSSRGAAANDSPDKIILRNGTKFRKKVSDCHELRNKNRSEKWTSSDKEIIFRSEKQKVRELCSKRLIVKIPISPVNANSTPRCLNGLISNDKNGKNGMISKRDKKIRVTKNSCAKKIETLSEVNATVNHVKKTNKIGASRAVSRNLRHNTVRERNTKKRVKPEDSTHESSESPPPDIPLRKRARFRETELAHLLKISPILGSKLRNSSNEEEDMCEDEILSPQNAENAKKHVTRRLKRSRKRANNVLSDDSSTRSDKYECDSTFNNRNKATASCVQGKYFKGSLPLNEESRSPLSPLSPYSHSPCMSPISTIQEPNPKTLKFQQMISDMNWEFAFENYPEERHFSFNLTEFEVQALCWNDPNALKLPYELDHPFKKSRFKMMANSRKSPRCHASTLAMMSSENPSSQSPVKPIDEYFSMFPDISKIEPDSPLVPVLSNPLTPPRTFNPILPSTPSALSSNPQIRRRGRRRSDKDMPASSSHPKSTSSIVSLQMDMNAKSGPKKDLPLVQYVWDSVQYLSDPYVLELLNQESLNKSCSNSSADHEKSSGRRLVEAAERRASLRSGDNLNSSYSSCCGAEAMSNNVYHSKLTSTPKCSPKSSLYNGSLGLENGFWDRSSPESQNRYSCRSPCSRPSNKHLNSSCGKDKSEADSAKLKANPGSGSPSETFSVSTTTFSNNSSPKAISGCAG